MPHLHQILSKQVSEWRTSGYTCDEYPSVAEILNFAVEDPTSGQLRYLRKAQFRALETYWYLRLVLGTPKVPDLYAKFFPKPKDRREALGITNEVFEACDYDFDTLFERVETNNEFVRANQLESLRETLTLDYPSYILALAMGAGKTILMGAIVATEFAMAQDDPKGPFVQNALVFAPGKTIIEALREIADIPFDRVLPPRMLKPFAASLKLTFTRDGDKALPIVWGSSWNVVVTNTEKIRIQRPTARNNGTHPLLRIDNKEEQAEELANLRLQAIASLPHLAVFSDEAHHTYGQKLLGDWKLNRETGQYEFIEAGIKKVRRTVDYLAQETNLVVVVNTTGTPYFERQPLRDVVVWYGLGEGIRDGVLKEVANNVKVFDLDEEAGDMLVRRLVEDFADGYWPVSLPDGSPARLALYFPTTEAVAELRPAVEGALVAKGIDPVCVLAVDNKSPDAVRAAFNRLSHDPSAPHRIVLLVNMGTEGWNCPSLFACGLVRQLRSSNNFVLQAATRCLRQVPGNARPARIYLSKGNRNVLAKQLEETYGATLADLNATRAERVEKTIRLHKPHLPPLLLRRRVRIFRRKADAPGTQPIMLTRPASASTPSGALETWSIAETAGRARLTRLDAQDLDVEPDTLDLYTAAGLLAANYHLPTVELLSALRAAYTEADGSMPEVPGPHLTLLGEQIEQQRADCEEDWQEIDIAVALVKKDGFEVHTDATGKAVYTARISFAKDRQHLYKMADDLPRPSTALDKSFHYEGYNFDSDPEAKYLEEVLNIVAIHAANIDGVWFTGGLTDPAKTDLYAEYLGEDGKWHCYTPDFVIRRKDGKHLVVEIKSEQHKSAIKEDLAAYTISDKPRSKEGRKAVAMRRIADLNPSVLEYEVIFADTLPFPADALRATRQFIAGGGTAPA